MAFDISSTTTASADVLIGCNSDEHSLGDGSHDPLTGVDAQRSFGTAKSGLGEKEVTKSMGELYGEFSHLYVSPITGDGQDSTDLDKIMLGICAAIEHIACPAGEESSGFGPMFETSTQGFVGMNTGESGGLF